MIILLRRPLFIVCVSLLLIVLGVVIGRYSEGTVRMVSGLVSQRLVPIYKVATEERRIALSFDATWGTEYTDELLALLAEHDVKTTFFLAGNWIEKHPDYVEIIADAGHEIGTHSYAHPHMNSMTKQQILDDLQTNHDLLKAITGEDPILFRPPFGEYSNKVIEAAEQLGYYTIQWSIDSLDWKDVSAQFMVQRVLDALQPGEIVLFHNAGLHTPAAVRTLIPELKRRGYDIVPIGELIYRDDYVIEPHSGVQRPKRPAALQPTSQIPPGSVFNVAGITDMASFIVNVDWGEDWIPPMLALFAEKDVGVTFFVTGRWAERHPQLLQRMADAGHEIANHGVSHVHPKRLSDEELRAHIMDNDALLTELTGGRAARLYTPPYGEWDSRIVALAKELGFLTILWTLDTIDWQDPSAATIVQRIVPRLEGGNIVLMHPRHNTLQALPQMIDEAHAKGLRLVPVGQMVAYADGL